MWSYSERVYGVRYPPNRIIEVPCGKCINCAKRRFFGYRMRLIYELQRYPNSLFVTLTFDNESLIHFVDDYNRSILLFLDRIRKAFGKQVRHWFVAEYGEKKGRIHYHGILFNCQMTNEELAKYWKYGHTFVGYANEITAKYIVKYLTKNDTKGSTPPRIISSKGIGDNWLDTAEANLIRSSLSTAIYIDSKPIPLPRFYIDKMYTQRDKEKISYYNFMENKREYWLAGRKYDDEALFKLKREQLYKQFASLGLHDRTDFEHKSRISSATRFALHLESYYNYLNTINYEY